MNPKEARQKETKARLAEIAQREADQIARPLTNPLKPDAMSGSHSDFMKSLRQARQREARENNTPDTSSKVSE